MADQDSGGGTGHTAGGADRPAVDLDALSDKVYRLMLADLRLESARAGRGPGRG